MMQSRNEVAQRFGLPPRDQVQKYRIWDSYFTPAHSNPGNDGICNWKADFERSQKAIELGCFEKLCYFAHVGIGTTSDPALEVILSSNPEIISSQLALDPTRLLAMVQLNGNDVHRSLDAIEQWITEGPMIGAYLPGGGPGAATCNRKELEPLYDRLTELNAVIMQHTWFKTGGKSGMGESTPSELAEVAKNYPEQVFIAAHAGGEWEKGIRAVREIENIWVETSGFDATAGFIEMAVRELGPHRIIFGSHLPSRSLGTELAKVIHAEISEHAKYLILGENFRKLVQSFNEQQRQPDVIK